MSAAMVEAKCTGAESPAVATLSYVRAKDGAGHQIVTMYHKSKGWVCFEPQQVLSGEYGKLELTETEKQSARRVEF